MAELTVLDNGFATMWYDPDKKIVHHKIHKFIYGQAFQDFLMTGTELIKKHQAVKWLSDDRDLPVLRKEDQDWGDSVWLPQTVSAGWKYWAIVQPEEGLWRMAVQELARQWAEVGITAQFFTTLEDATQWLESQN